MLTWYILVVPPTYYACPLDQNADRDVTRLDYFANGTSRWFDDMQNLQLSFEGNGAWLLIGLSCFNLLREVGVLQYYQ